MVVTLYKSALCPRCHMAHKHITEALQNEPDMTLTTVDVVSSPRKTWNDGIRMIPAIKIENEVLSALYLSKEEIKNFIDGKR